MTGENQTGIKWNARCRDSFFITRHPYGPTDLLPDHRGLQSSKIAFSLTTAGSPNSLTEDEGVVEETSSQKPLTKHMPSENITMTDQRQHIRYQVEFPAAFSGDYDGIGIVYNLGMGGCKVVSDLPVKNGARLTVHLQTQGQPIAITIQTATVQWTLQHEFGVEFREMLEQERTRLGQFLATQSNIVP